MSLDLTSMSLDSFVVDSNGELYVKLPPEVNETVVEMFSETTGHLSPNISNWIPDTPVLIDSQTIQYTPKTKNPRKKGSGRPKGSKNKKTSTVSKTIKKKK